MKSVHLKFGVLVLLLALFAVPMMAQNSGTIQGTVVDPQGAVVPGATVQAIDAAKGVVVRETTTGAEGLFVLTPLQPGTYNLKVIAKGMKDMTQTGLVLISRQTLEVPEFKLAVGSANENVTVEAVQPLIETGTADRAQVIDNKQVTEISMNGRDFQSLIRTLPGVVSNDGSDFRLAFNNTDSFHVNGMRGSSNNAFLDGAVNTDVGANDGQFTQLSMDAVGEFKLQNSNFAAEYGRNPGVLMAINTKSGGKTYHGTVYEFNRQDGFDALPYFNKVDRYGAAKDIQPNSKLRFNQFGANFGGPIPISKVKDKLFFFFNYEGTRAGRPSTQTGSTYTMDDPKWLTGDFSSALKAGTIAGTTYQNGQMFVPGTLVRDGAGNIIQGRGEIPIPGNIITPAMQAADPRLRFGTQAAAWTGLLQPLYRTGYTYDPNNLAQVIVPLQDTYNFTKNQKVLRVDYNINDKANFFFRWVDDAQKESYQNFPLAWGTQPIPVMPEYRKKPGASWSWNLVNVISPTVTNEFIFAYNHLTQVVDINGNGQAYTADALGFSMGDIYPQTNTHNLFPSFRATGNTSFVPFSPGWGSEGLMYTFTDNLTKSMGAHTLKFGGFFDYNRAWQQPSWQEAPVFNFQPGANFNTDSNNGVANMLFGNYNSVSQTNGYYWGDFKFHQWEAFAQDSWKVNRKLTLELGVRWAYLEPTYTVKPFLQNYFDPKAWDPAQAVTLYTGPTVFNAQGQPIAINNSICNPTLCPGLSNYGNPYNGMVQEGTKGYPLGFVDHHWGNFMPRVGFSWDPTGSGKTVIRGGVGTFYERVRQNVNSFDGLGNPPLVKTATIYNGTDATSLSSLGASSILGLNQNVNTMQRDGKIPVTYSWSIGVQRELPKGFALDVAYVGNQARHLQYIVDLQQLPIGTQQAHAAPVGNAGDPSFNPPVGGVQPNSATWWAGVQYPGYQAINYTNYGANSEYNALQFSVRRRFAKSLMVSADYTYSKNNDLSDADNTFSSVRDRFNPWADWGPTGWDRRHAFNANWVYTLPDFKKDSAFGKYVLGGWEITGVFRKWSGTPFSATCGGNSGAFTGTATPTCDYIGGNAYAKGGNPTDAGGAPYYPAGTSLAWLNPAAFAQAPQGQIGDTTRNQFYGPGYYNLNLSLFKNIQFNERMRMQLRLETFNTLNNMQFNGVANGLGTLGATTTTRGLIDHTTVGSSGLINGARDPRQLQLGIKLYF